MLAPNSFLEAGFRLTEEAGFEAILSPFLFKPPVCEVVWLVSRRQEATPARQHMKIMSQKRNVLQIREEDANHVGQRGNGST